LWGTGLLAKGCDFHQQLIRDGWYQGMAFSHAVIFGSSQTARLKACPDTNPRRFHPATRTFLAAQSAALAA
jgi:hypothetical protein